MPIVSIIVPVYNVERYLDDCLKSILLQDYTDFECVLVNDGSTDNSKYICNNYKNKDSRFVVLNQNNSGVTKARFNGVKVATGEYIMFVDSDDVLNPNSLRVLLQESKDYDIVIGHTKLFPPAFVWPYSPKNGEYHRFAYLKELIAHKVHGGPCARIIKKELFNDFVYDIPDKIVCGEDYIMNIRLCLNVKAVRIVDEVVYNYRYLEHDCKQSVFMLFQRMVVEIRSIIFLKNSVLHQLYLLVVTIFNFFIRSIKSIVKRFR